MPEISEDVLLADLEKRLVSTYSNLPSAQVADAIRMARKHFDESTVRDFVPLLVERRVRAELTSQHP